MGSLFLTCLQHLAYRDPTSQVSLSSSVPQSCAYVGLQPVLWQKGITHRGARSQEGPVLVVMLSRRHLEIVKNCNSELIFGEGSPMGHGMVLVKGDMNYSCSCHPFLPTIVYSPQTPPEHTLWNFSWTHRELVDVLPVGQSKQGADRPQRSCFLCELELSLNVERMHLHSKTHEKPGNLFIRTFCYQPAIQAKHDDIEKNGKMGHPQFLLLQPFLIISKLKVESIECPNVRR